MDVHVQTDNRMQEPPLLFVWYLPNSKNVLLGMIQYGKGTSNPCYTRLRLSCALLLMPSLLPHL